MSDSRLPRREFIATGVGLAAAALTSTRVGAISPNDKINVGIVGCGVRGNYILGEAITAGAGRINVVGICDVWKVARDKMAADLADKHGMKPESFARHQDLLALPGLDAVIIATPDHAHCAVLTDVVRAGKDAYVEKPLSARLEDAISDTAEYVFEFPKGWILTLSSRLGSGPEIDYEVFHGRERTLDSRDWTSRPAANRRPADAADLVLPAATETSTGSLTQGDAGPHVANWIECLGTRKQPNAPIEVGLAHAIVCCLGREAERTGRKMKYDATARRIVEA